MIPAGGSCHHPCSVMAEVGGWTSEGFHWRPCRHGITIVRRIRGCQARMGELLTVHETQAHTTEGLAVFLEWSAPWIALACGFFARRRRCSTMRVETGLKKPGIVQRPVHN